MLPRVEGLVEVCISLGVKSDGLKNAHSMKAADFKSKPESWLRGDYS
jgi:hypothetical protein